MGCPITDDIGSDYLRRAAELGHTKAQSMLAEEHRSGANGQAKDETLYLYWIDKAVEGGSEDAIYSHAKYLADKGSQVPDVLMADLASIAEQWPNAAKLLEKLKRKR